MAAKKRAPKVNAKPRSITLRAQNPQWQMIQDVRNLRSRKQGKQLSTNTVLLQVMEEEHRRSNA